MIEKCLTEYPDLLTIDEVAKIIRVSKSTVYGLIKDEKIKAFKFGRQYKCPKVYIVETYLK